MGINLLSSDGLGDFHWSFFRGFLSKSNSDWSWLVGDKVLKVSSGNVGIEEGGNVVAV